MPDRFFTPDLVFDQAEIVIDQTEAHHLLHVLRAKPGLAVEVFNGQGLSALGEIRECKRKEVVVALESFQRSAESTAGLTLAVALPKGDRARWLVEKATELGVSRLIPLETQRSVKELNKKGLTKLEQSVVAACKQSRRDWLMPIADSLSWQKFSEQQHEAGQPWGLCHLSEQTIPISQFASENAGKSVTIAIGPEGGWTEEEAEMAMRSGASSLQLGSTILRTETAALAVAALWNGF